MVKGNALWEIQLAQRQLLISSPAAVHIEQIGAPCWNLYRSKSFLLNNFKDKIRETGFKHEAEGGLIHGESNWHLDCHQMSPEYPCQYCNWYSTQSSRIFKEVPPNVAAYKWSGYLSAQVSGYQIISDMWGASCFNINLFGLILEGFYFLLFSCWVLFDRGIQLVFKMCLQLKARV